MLILDKSKFMVKNIKKCRYVPRNKASKYKAKDYQNSRIRLKQNGSMSFQCFRD